jgi:carbonic anhydrase
MTSTDRLLEANRKYAAGFRKGHLKNQGARRLAVLTCMDARINTAAAFGLREGDANVLRNEGGRANEFVLNGLIVARALLGVREIAVIHHTDCGLLAPSEAEFRRRIEASIGEIAPQRKFMTFADVDEGVREDLRIIGSVPELAGMPVRGFVYDVKTGTLREVPGSGD